MILYEELEFHKNEAIKETTLIKDNIILRLNKSNFYCNLCRSRD